ncbi:hypothetical protein [Ruania zhangjianzhongii]|uniref:hypothetical protein n=1 Tax=Ruania zhangjianzhongii TaxID=2603206 RepID=UPI0011C85E23|nr:hypothetical protein [Ruania zhangjianzhongii]
MSGIYSSASSDPFGGRYADRGLIFGRDSAENRPDRPRYVSGVAMAIGMVLVWASFFGPLLTAGLVGLSWWGTTEGWVMPDSAPSAAVSGAALLGVWLVSSITALVARRDLRRLRVTGGLVKLAVSALVLGAGLWWAVSVNQIPL